MTAPRWNALLVTVALVSLPVAVAAKPRRAPATLGGTVVWSGPPPSFVPDERDWESSSHSCEVHDFEIQGRRDLDGIGLANVIVWVEPVDEAARQQLVALPDEGGATEETPYRARELDWGHDEHVAKRLRVAYARPGRALDVQSGRTLRFFSGDKLVASFAPGQRGGVLLPEGVIHVLDDDGHEGWVFVTPFPAHISSGNCRFVFSPLPPGKYRLHGWHPLAGERVRKAVVGGELTPSFLLTFGRRPPKDSPEGRDALER